MQIFITGNSRSGTTMMSRILGNHESVLAFQELHFFDELVPTDRVNQMLNARASTNLFATLCSIQRDGYFGKREPGKYEQEATMHLGSNATLTGMEVYKDFIFYEAHKNGKQVPCKQTPQNLFALEAILKSMPDSKVIVMIRDPRAVMLSQKNKWKRRQLTSGKIPFMESLRSRINYHPKLISKIWNSAMAATWKIKDDTRVKLVHYEQLIKDPAVTVKDICKFLGITFNDKMLDIPVVGSSNFGDEQSKRGIDNSRQEQWNKGGLNESEIYILQETSSKWMELAGYPKQPVNPSALQLARYNLELPFRIILIVLFNLKRLKNPSRLIKRFLNN